MKKRNKIQPSVQTMTFNIASVPNNATARFYIDLSQCASILNRRFYRQGINWAVAGFKFVGSVPMNITVSKLPNTWVTSNAWEKAFRAWDKQQKDDLEEAGGMSAMAKFRDFKVFMGANHVDQYFASGSDLNVTNQLPITTDFTGGIVRSTGGEWEPSQIVLPMTLPDASGSLIEPQEYLLHMVGANVNGSLSRGVIEGYADSRAYPQSPDPVSRPLDSAQNWMRAMFDVGNDNPEVIANATDTNDELPYPQVDYPGGELQLPGLQVHDLVRITETNPTNGISVRGGKGGNFPCGLIALDTTAFGDGLTTNLTLQVDLIPGNHRGYLCEPMTEM